MKKMQVKTIVTEAGETVEFMEGSGNVYADLGLPDADEMLLKADIAVQIHRIIRQKNLTEEQAAELVGLDEAKLSGILRGRFRTYSLERLLGIVNRLGHSVEVRISAQEARPNPARVVVTMRGSKSRKAAAA